MIAKAVDIDISTLYYHWGEKGDLYMGLDREQYIRHAKETLKFFNLAAFI